MATVRAEKKKVIHRGVVYTVRVAHQDTGMIYVECYEGRKFLMVTPVAPTIEVAIEEMLRDLDDAFEQPGTLAHDHKQC